MKIAIAERLKPYSHTSGTGCPIPGTLWTLIAYPTRLEMYHGSKKIILSLGIKGPVDNFTLQLDLERGSILIFGQSKEGYYRLRLEASDEGFDLYAEKTPAGGIETSQGRLHPKDQIHFPVELTFHLAAHTERFSLGNHKEQDWDLVTRRLDLKELIPPFLNLAQKIPCIEPQPLQIDLPKGKPEKNQIEPLLRTFFQVGLKQLLVPRIHDDHYQGIDLIRSTAEAEPYFLIQQMAQWIRSLFFTQNERRLEILPALSPEFNCGRFIGIRCPGIGTLDFEWTKFFLRQSILKAEVAGEVLFDLQKGIESFRVRRSLREKGKRHNAHEPLLLEPNKTYYLDRFQK